MFESASSPTLTARSFVGSHDSSLVFQRIASLSLPSGVWRGSVKNSFVRAEANAEKLTKMLCGNESAERPGGEPHESQSLPAKRDGHPRQQAEAVCPLELPRVMVKTVPGLLRIRVRFASNQHASGGRMLGFKWCASRARRPLGPWALPTYT